MADKKDPNAEAPNKKFLIIGGILLVLGLSGVVWEAFLRPPTKEELQEMEEKKKDEEFFKKHGRKRPSH